MIACSVAATEVLDIRCVERVGDEGGGDVLRRCVEEMDVNEG